MHIRGGADCSHLGVTAGVCVVRGSPVAIAIPLHCYFIAALDVDVIYHLFVTQPMIITSAAFAPYPHECPWVGRLGSLDIGSKSATGRDRA